MRLGYAPGGTRKRQVAAERPAVPRKDPRVSGYSLEARGNRHWPPPGYVLLVGHAAGAVAY